MLNSKLQVIAAFSLLISVSFSAYSREMVFVGQDIPPWSWDEKGTMTGRVVDVLKEACKELKHTCKINPAPLARANKQLEDGEIDGILSTTHNSERDKYSVISATLFTMKKIYMTKPEYKIAPMKDAKELAGYTLVVVRGGSNSKIVAKHVEETKTSIMKEETDYNTQLLKIKNDQYGTKALAMGSEDTLKYYAAKEKMELVPVLEVKEENFGIAFGKKKVTAAEIEEFNTVFQNMAKNGTLKKILGR